VLVDVLAELP